MDNNDRQAIEGLFGKLSQVEQQAASRDAEAESFIRERVAAQPSSPYFMAQTIVVQEQALNAAQQRIEELEYQAASRPASGGGLLSGLFGGGRQPAAPARPSPRPNPAFGGAAPAGPWGQQGMQQQGRGGGGGFLAGAAQTAMGVAGGVLLGNAIAGMFAGDEANAAEPAVEEEAPADEMDGMDDMGGEF